MSFVFSSLQMTRIEFGITAEKYVSAVRLYYKTESGHLVKKLQGQEDNEVALVGLEINPGEKIMASKVEVRDDRPVSFRFIIAAFEEKVKERPKLSE